MLAICFIRIRKLILFATERVSVPTLSCVLRTLLASACLLRLYWPLLWMFFLLLVLLVVPYALSFERGGISSVTRSLIMLTDIFYGAHRPQHATKCCVYAESMLRQQRCRTSLSPSPRGSVHG